MSRTVSRASQPAARSAVGRIEVSDHVGEPAGRAAQAVRRSGLRPALERSFGYDTELVGSVVAQEPAAGGELARGGTLTLFVAAPAPPRPTEPQPPADEEQPPPEAPPPPATVSVTRRPQAPAAAGRPAVGEAPPSRSGPADTSGPAEEDLARAARVFADARTQWRRAYPRRPMSSGLRSVARVLARHRMLSVFACCLLAVWAARALTPSPAAHRLVGGPPASRPVAAGVPPAAPRVRSARRANVPRATHRRSTSATARSGGSRRVSLVGRAGGPTVAEAPPPGDPSPTPPSASTSTGGEFSP